jgi:hypothetical protein
MHRFIERGLFVGENLVETVLGHKIYCVRFQRWPIFGKLFILKSRFRVFPALSSHSKPKSLGACWIEADFGCLSAKFV